MLINQLICLGISHKTGNIEQRELMSTAVSQFQNGDPHVLISTCNRVELYSSNPQALSERIRHWQQAQPVEYDTLTDSLYIIQGENVANHLHQVASGLDSMVLGEAQILGQIRQAYETAVSTKQLDQTLDTLFKSAIRTGKRVRTETKIAHFPASMSAIALQQAQNQLGNLKNKRFLLIGLGEMGRITLKALQARGLTQIDIANRSQHKAETAVDNGTAYGLDQLSDALTQADVVFAATRITQPLITRASIEAILPQRQGRPLIIVDLGVPRNVETAIANLPNVTLINVDGLQTNLDHALSARQAEIPAAEQIIGEEIGCLHNEFKTNMVTPTIKALREKAEAIRQSELSRTMRYLKEVDDQTLKHIEHLSQALVKKLLHEPTLQLRTKAKEGEADTAVATLRELFDLTEVEPS
ncbi:MAG: glutamyl-tRNA reductase [Chloroflexota bacterium]